MKNIIYITGNDSYGREKEVLRWIGAFVGKYGDINIDRYRLDDRKAFPSIRDQLTMSGLFVEKRLFLFSGGVERKGKSGGFEEILEATEIPGDHFCLFSGISPKEETLIVWLTKNADVRSIDTVWNLSEWAKRFPNLDTKAIQKVLDTYRLDASLQEKGTENDLIGHSIAKTLELIDLAGTDTDIEKYIHVRGGGKIFDLVDAIVRTDAKKSVEIIRKITQNTSSLEILSSLIGLLRSHLYVKYLARQGKKESEIAKMIPIHPYVLGKSLQSKISFDTLRELMEKLSRANIAYKRGLGLKNAELGRIFAIELALMSLKK